MSAIFSGKDLGEHPDAAQLAYRSSPDAEVMPTCATCEEIFDGHPDAEECECCVAEGQLAYMREHDARAER